MKKSFVLSAVALLVLLVSCNNDEKKIIEAARKYLEATANYRIEEAYPYATKATRETTLPYITDIMMPMVDSNYIASNKPATIELDSLLIVGDTAWVLYTKTTPLRQSINTIYLIKEEGKWLVDVPLDIPETITVGPSGVSTDNSNITPGTPQKISKKKK